MPIRPGRAPPYRHAAACPHSWNTIDTIDRPSTTKSSSGRASTSRYAASSRPDRTSHTSAVVSRPSITTTTGGRNNGPNSRATICTPVSGNSVPRSRKAKIAASGAAAGSGPSSPATSPSGVSLLTSRYSIFPALTVRPNSTLTRAAISPAARVPSTADSTSHSNRDRWTT